MSNFKPLARSFSAVEGQPTSPLGPTEKFFNDPLHGYIAFDSFCTGVIDTPQFQRLRYLKQLGASYFVFPGASHNRFEHCLGVGYLAGSLVRRFQESQPELGITKRDVRCVQVAGLCHDLGHGPFSHLFDSTIVPRLSPGLGWTHEQGSQMMFEYMVDDNYLDLDQQDVRFINDLIVGKPTSQGAQSQEKLFLFDIVANQRNGVDVDKFDYLGRDCYNVGLKSSCDSSRLMIASRVIDDQICYHHKEVYNLYDMFHTRFSLFKRIYTHRVESAIELMIVDALVQAEPELQLIEALRDPERYLNLTDDILRDIERSRGPELASARALLKRLRRRDLYRFVDEVVLPGHLRGTLTKRHINAEAVVAHQGDNAHLTVDDVTLKWYNLNFGKNDENPVDSIRFYSKFDDRRCFAVPQDA
ncbi:hypothetical protein IWQ60_002083 [Tieghemiomyces parasiticus]|uniref:HD/PDEase domain-containing protein n=1 Tax=Tieghemiomyces parasiticus TaxID=78921 RepID=A0A9W8AJM0_9FUNG|nr:hypothetical protein IWQ60_002083 [Tieghemiomyces parasiticus]